MIGGGEAGARGCEAVIIRAKRLRAKVKYWGAKAPLAPTGSAALGNSNVNIKNIKNVKRCNRYSHVVATKKPPIKVITPIVGVMMLTKLFDSV